MKKTFALISDFVSKLPKSDDAFIVKLIITREQGSTKFEVGGAYDETDAASAESFIDTVSKLEYDFQNFKRIQLHFDGYNHCIVRLVDVDDIVHGGWLFVDLFKNTLYRHYIAKPHYSTDIYDMRYHKWISAASREVAVELRETKLAEIFAKGEHIKAQQ